jgi:hypothetical protein
LRRKEIRSPYPATYRAVDIEADNHTRTTAHPRPQHLPNPSSTPPVTVRTNLSQVGALQSKNYRHMLFRAGVFHGGDHVLGAQRL